MKSAIPQDSAKIISALLVTMQNAHPDPSKWAYTGQEGALVLIVDKINGGFWFKIVDLKVRVLCFDFGCCRESDIEFMFILAIKIGH